MPPPKTMTIQVSDGAELSLRIWRTSNANEIPLLLLHGLSQQGRFWGPVVDRLRAGTVATLDQRGHGLSDVPGDSDFTIERCAQDVSEVCSTLGWDRVILVGHSWGASVAICAGAKLPQVVATIGLIDGGLWGPSDLVESIGRDEVLERLRPPKLAMAPPDLWSMLQRGALAPWWCDETTVALEPTFRLGQDGLLRSTLGLERHLRVLEGMLDYSPDADLANINCPIWAVLCESDDMVISNHALIRAAAISNIRLQRWQGAVHDVPLQWPALVAGLIDTMVETEHLHQRKGPIR